LIGCFVMVVVVTVHYKRMPRMEEEEEEGEEAETEDDKEGEFSGPINPGFSPSTSNKTKTNVGRADSSAEEKQDALVSSLPSSSSSSDIKPKKTKQRRLSSREFMREQSSMHPVKDIEMIQLSIREREEGGGEDDGGEEGGGEVGGGETKIIMQHENPHWSKVRNSVKASKALKAEGKKKEKRMTKRLSRVMKARHNSATSDKNESSNIAIEVNENSGN